MTKKEEQPSNGSALGMISFFLVVLIGGVIIAVSMNSCNRQSQNERDQNERDEADQEAHVMKQGLDEAKAARGALPVNFVELPVDNFIISAHDCAVLMANKLDAENWFRWTNSAIDRAPENLKERANDLLIGIADYATSSFFENALNSIPEQVGDDENYEVPEFTFYVTTTSDTFGGLKNVLRTYSCDAFSSDHVWLRQVDAQLY